MLVENGYAHEDKGGHQRACSKEQQVVLLVVLVVIE